MKVYTNTVTIGVLSTGNELVGAGIERLPVGKIRDSNRVMLKAIIRQTCGLLNLTEHVNVVDLGIVKDNGLAIDQAIKAAVEHCNILVTSGGVSMGELDLMKPYIEKEGTVHFGRLNMKPGKPTTFGTIGSCLVFALPGNPVSSFVSASLFIPAAVQTLLGKSHHFAKPEEWPVTVVGRLYPSMIACDKMRPEYHRCTLYQTPEGQVHAISTGPNQASSHLLSTSGSNAFALIPANTSGLYSCNGQT